MRLLFLFYLVILPVLGAGLSREEAQTYASEQYQKLSKKREITLRDLKEGFQYFEIKGAQQTMRCIVKQYGDAPAGKRSLYLSMHGGGGAPAQVNDQQWNNQVGLYQPDEGYYVAPRAPTNTWNLWHESHIDLLFSKLIEDFVALKGVDPNRVYLMGYSAGGDGVYQLAPRMADRLGAASMMAGHPNDASPDGLRNLPFRIYMGGKDAAYKRNEVAAQWAKTLEKLQNERGGYDHKVTIYPEFGHWMNRKDAEAVPWMGKQVRQPWPEKIVWGDSRNRSQRFYWLSDIKEGVIHAQVLDQTIQIDGVGKQGVTIWLSDELINLDEPIRIVVDGRERVHQKIERSKKAIDESLAQRLDPAMVASALFRIKPSE